MTNEPMYKKFKNDKLSYGNAEARRMEIENWGKYQADRDEQVVVEVEEEMRDGGEDDIEIIGGNGPETLNKNSYIENWLEN